MPEKKQSPAIKKYMKLLFYDIMDWITSTKHEVSEEGIVIMLNKYNDIWGIPTGNQMKDYFDLEKWDKFVHHLKRIIHFSI